MPIEVTTRHMQGMEDIQEYAESRAAELADAFRGCEHVHVILDHEKHLFKAEVVIQAGHHVRIEAEEEVDNMRAAIDGAFEKAERQFRRLRDKVKDHHSAMKYEESKKERGEEI
ncbi:MAG: ribosome-associated translation inhibitor RaiA [Kiritimatiellae bacterium]|nr:ribosome-associated translation inhibitor RaiA [Kiritimatiellia bacterium]